MPHTRFSLGLWAAAALLFNFPLILIWDRDVTVAGLPLLPVAMFVIWALLIVLLAFVAEARPARRPPPSG
ncbi:hypothetical protein FHS82_002508 [Pseudochelatococcus lubricantis]|uniref:DUF3311 domain-containing protein n=1 Tax=Pseudochelatococcus lubricantis TaxID=1538102 RepID=A0ABX0V4D7_9HYPH|nr:hypothetical protein [Pseudochelatococcus lubricantis]NIJ58660.1 hypothetical protein [Pseudochelatococcus lubricantis]